MSCYRDFVQDFPNRCHSILNDCYGNSERNKNEVTLLLMTACAGFLISYENLKEKRKLIRGTESEARSELLNYLGAKLSQLKRSKSFWIDDNNLPKTLKYIVTKGDCSGLDIDQWPEMIDQNYEWEDAKRMVFSQFLIKIRNALAHGNIITTGDGPKKIERNIKTIFFISENRENNELKNYTIICMSPNDFKYFLESWFVLLCRLNIHPSTASNLLDADAA